jgi:hypothetical protein
VRLRERHFRDIGDARLSNNNTNSLSNTNSTLEGIAASEEMLGAILCLHLAVEDIQLPEEVELIKPLHIHQIWIAVEDSAVVADLDLDSMDLRVEATQAGDQLIDLLASFED